MGQFELTEELARAGAKKGEVRNPTGWNNPVQRMRNRDIKVLLRAEADAPCEVPGYEHLTKLQFALSAVMDKAMDGDKWAVSFVTNRLFGRVPLNVDVEVGR